MSFFQELRKRMEKTGQTVPDHNKQSFGERDMKNEQSNPKTQKSIREQFSSRRFRVGLYSLIATILVATCVIVLNLIVSRLPATWTRFDASEVGYFTFSQQTKDILTGLEQDVMIYHLVQKSYEDDVVVELLDRYAALSGHLKIKRIDPVKLPNFASQYTDEKIQNNSLIVTCGIRSYYVDYNDIYVMEVDLPTYAATGTIAYNYSWDGEGALNRAVNYVTSSNQIKIFQLMGHGEKKLPDSFLDAVVSENYEYSELSLLMEDDIPQECDMLLINAPQVDINMSEQTKMISYLQNGGRLLLISDTGICDLPNLRYVMEQYGAEPMQGSIVEGDRSYSLYGYAHYLLPEFGEHPIVQPLKDGRYSTLLPASHGIRFIAPRDSVKMEPLLTTSTQSYLKADGFGITTYERQESDIDGPFNIGIAIEESNDPTEPATRIVWVASPYLLDDSVNTMVSGTNQDVFLNSIAWLCDEENHITIHVKSMDVEYLIVPDASAKVWSIVLVGVIPGIFFVICIVVWLKRRWK